MRKQIVLVTVITAIAQAAGFVKLWVIARLFGVGPELDGYNLALVVPTLISGIFSGMIQTGLFPVRAQIAAQGNLNTVEIFDRGVLLLCAVVGFMLALGLAAARPLIQPLVAPGATPAILEVLYTVWPLACALVAFNVLGDALSNLLAMRDRFAYAAAAPIANALFGTVLLLASSSKGVVVLAMSTALGLALQVWICLLALQAGDFRVFGALPESGSALKDWGEMARLGVRILPGVVFSNLTLTLPGVMLASHGEGAVSAFGYAQRIHFYTVQLLVMATSPLILAKLSDLVARGDEDSIGRLLKEAASLSVLLGLASTLLVWYAGSLLLEWFFSGRFDHEASVRVGSHWVWLTIGLAPALLGNVFAKLWQARRRAGSLSVLSGLGLIMMLISVWTLSTVLGEFAVSAALSLTAYTVLFGFFYQNKRRAISGTNSVRRSIP